MRDSQQRYALLGGHFCIIATAGTRGCPQSEGVMGMGRAFQYAGAKNVLVSLWSVAEKSTTDFTAEFFTALKAGKTPRTALKEARAKIRAEGYEHPFFWAPFILMGE